MRKEIQFDEDSPREAKYPPPVPQSLVPDFMSHNPQSNEYSR